MPSANVSVHTPSCAVASPCVPSSYIGAAISAPLPPTRPSKYDSVSPMSPVVLAVRAVTVIGWPTSSLQIAYGETDTSFNVNDGTPGAGAPLAAWVVAVPPPAPPPQPASNAPTHTAAAIRIPTTHHLGV